MTVLRGCSTAMRVSLCSGFMAIFACVLANAQTAGDGQVDKSGPMLEEVIVTATRRAEGLQDVPVSVAVVSGETMTALGINDIAGLAPYIPNFQISDSNVLPNLYIRGIGTGTSNSVEQSVGRFVDDVYIGRGAINLHGMMDVQSVEVLRGPQGTLFGKNTLGGAVIVHTRNPTRELSGGLDVSSTDFSTVGGTQIYDGFLSGPLSDSTRGRVAIQYKDRDGYIDNLLPGPDGGTREDFGVRGKLEWDATDRTVINLKLEHLEYNEDGLQLTNTASRLGDVSNGAAAPFQGAVPSFAFGNQWVSYVDCAATLGPGATTFCPDRDQESQNVTVKIEHELSGGTLESVSAYQRYEFLHHFPAVDSGIIGGALRATRDETYSGISQELRFVSAHQGRLDYLAGLYLEKSDLERLQDNEFNIPAFLGGGPLLNRREDWKQDTSTIAAFGQLRVDLTDSVSATLGGRWATEEKEFLFEGAEVPYQTDSSLATDFVTSLERSESKFTPSLSLQWSASDAAMFYASASQGHKTGGFSDRVQSNPEFSEETANAFEIGFKGALFAGALEANIALFHVQIDDLQVASSLPPPDVAFEIKNAAEATSQGVEFDGRWRLHQNWVVRGSYAYTDAAYDDFPGAAATCPDAGGFIENGLCNFSGLPLIYAPKQKGALVLEFAKANFLNAWGVKTLLSTTYSDEYYSVSYVGTLLQPSYSSIDASVGLVSPDDKWRLTLFGRNLTEEYVMQYGVQLAGTDVIEPGTPREVGLKVSYRY